MRISKARQEMEKAPEFDYILNNSELTQACEEAKVIIGRFLKS
jgi:guanylate kinase